METVASEVIHFDFHMSHLLDALATLSILAVVSDAHHLSQVDATVHPPVTVGSV
jgi:hypothetical protein